MRKLAPSLLAADFFHLNDQLAEIEKAGVEILHIDVMDGMFVPSISFGFPVIESLRNRTGLFFDVHLMITEPSRYIERFARAGADSITVHLEACADVGETLRQIRSNGCRTGLSIRPATPVEAVYPYLEQLDMVLIMTVEPGFGGQKYLTPMNQKIAALRDKIDADGSKCLIEVDGGINRSTLPDALHAGADVIVAGTAVFGGNIAENVSVLQEMLSALPQTVREDVL